MNPCPKVITGPLHVENKTASDWGHQGFVAYGCYGYAVVIDPVTLQVIQTLGPHSGYVTHVRWSGENYHHAFATGSTYNLHLATADGTGNVVIWDVASGQRRTELCDTRSFKPVLELDWYTGNEESHDLLMVLRSPDCLELWDAFSGVRLWKKQFGDQLITFTLDPFDIQRLVLLCESPYLLVVNDINVTREPSDYYRCVRIFDPQPTVVASGNQKNYSSGSLSRSSSSSLTKMASLATNMLTGPEQNKKRQTSINEEDQDLLTSCKQVVFNPAHRHIILLVFSTEIHMFDLDVDLTISTTRLDRLSPKFAKVIPCRNSDMLSCLHENGSVSVRVRRQTNNTEKFQNKDAAMDMTFDLVCQSDPLRLLRNSKVFTMVYHPISEKQMALILSDSRVIFLDILTTEYSKPEESCLFNKRPRLGLAEMIGSSTIVQPGGQKRYLKGEITLRIVMSGLVSGIISPITAIESVPVVGDIHAVGNLVAVGSGSGTVQLVNLYSGQVEKEFKLFTSPVRGIQWVYSRHLVVFTYPDQPSYGNRAIKSEVVILNVISGKFATLFEGNDKKGVIVMVKVSSSRNYCVVVFKQGSMELWNLKSQQLVREMVIDELIKPSDVEWYPYVGSGFKEVVVQDNNGRERTIERRVVREQLFICGQIYGGSPIMRLQLDDGVMSAATCFKNENLFDGQYHRAEIIQLAWKKKLAIIADKVGVLFLVDCADVNIAKKFSDRPGGKVEDILFAPGKDNMTFLVKYSNSVDIWEITNQTPELLTSSPTLPSNLIKVCWAGPESVVMVTEESFLHVLDISRKTPMSPVEKEKDDFVHVKNVSMKSKNSPVSKWKLSGIFSAALLEPKLAFLFKYSLQCNIQPMSDAITKYCSQIDSETLKYIQDGSTSTADRCYQVARLFGDKFDMEFWRMVQYASLDARQDKLKLTDINKPLDMMELCSNLVFSTPETNDLVNLDLSSDLDISTCSDSQRSEGGMDISWLNSMERDNINVGLITGLGEMMKCTHYKVYETSRLDLHNKRRCDYRVKQLCSSRYIMTGRVDMAVQVLMETDTELPEFKACLSSCTTQHTGTSLSTVKLAATHLIVAGQLSDGVDLLCLIGKHLDACKYLISYGKWQEAVWLAKTNLSKKECLDIIYKWADHLWNKSQRTKAMLLMLSHEQFATVLHMLCCQRQFDTAALYLQSCIEQGLLEKSQYTDSVFVEFSKLLTVTEYHSAVKHYCHLAGEKGDNYIADLDKK